MSTLAPDRAPRRRVPLRMQVTSADCGAACLAMIASAHRVPVRTSDVRTVLPESEDALDAGQLLRAGRALGLRGQAYRVDPRAVVHAPMPSIAWWNGMHFVVLEHADETGVRVVDPARGRSVLSHAEFGERFSRVVLGFERDPALVAPRFARRLLPAGTALPPAARTGVIVVLTLVLQLLAAASPLLMREVADRAVPGRGGLPWVGLAGAALLAVLAHAAAVHLRGRLVVDLRLALSAAMVDRLVDRVLALPFPFFLRRSSADVLAGLQSAEMLREFVSERLVVVLLDCCAGLVYLAVVFAVAPPLGVVALVVLVVLLGLAAVSSRRSGELTQASMNDSSAAQALLVEAVVGIETVQATGGESYVLTRWRARYRDLQRALRLRDRTLASVQATSQSVQFAGGLALLLTAVLLVPGGALSIGDLLALVALGAAAVGPVTSAIATVQHLSLALAHVDRLRDLSSAEHRPLRRGVPDGDGALEVRDVAFAYGGHRPVVDGVSMTVRPGEVVGIVGPSGAGKSTLLRLLLGLLDPDRGDVVLDGMRLADIDRRMLPWLVAVVPQHPVVLSGSLAENVAFGRRLDRDRVVEALRRASLLGDLPTLRLGIDTPVGEAGARLSGGQRQRLALARALYGRPRVLVLDEPTSALDALTERAIRSSLAEIGCTQVIVAHRLATLQHADRVHVLDAGRVVDAGSPAELLGRAGLYRAMAVAQGLTR
jgi:ATP-binding cassette, subfamily B, bacterial